MNCPNCQRPMIALFTSYACDHCEGRSRPAYARGYVVLHEGAHMPAGPVYLFRTRTDAARWRVARKCRHVPIREVLTEAPVQWRTTSGTLQDVELADRPFEIFADHRYPPAPNHAFLAP